MKTIKIASALLILLTALIVTSCGDTLTPYETNDADGYSVSVKFDANGGVFTTNSQVIVDSYNIADVKKNSDGEAEIRLLSPDDERRGSSNAFTAQKSGYFLAGWYSERTETLDENGETVYVYGGKWDFGSDVLTVDVNGEYSSASPELTLYAAWIPLFEIEFYTASTGELVGTYQFHPETTDQIRIPQWNTETGAIDMFDFPVKDGYTFNGAYLDQEGTIPVTDETVAHPGIVDYESGTAKDSKMKLYIDWLDGEWYNIYTAEQLTENASVSGNYNICADLDFTDEIWPSSLTYASFSGSIIGNGHTISNVKVTQTNNSKTNVGLFGNISESARIENVTFENISFTIEAGTRVAGTSYGLFAGSVSDGAAIDGVVLKNSALYVDSGAYFGTDDYSIGIVAGMGTANVETDGITVGAVGDAPESIQVTLTDGEVTVLSTENQ